MELHERLKWARERRGFETAADAARFLKIPYATYAGHENGLRGIPDRQRRVYAAAFRVNLMWLAYGRGDPEEGLEGDQVPVIGVIGRLGEVFPVTPSAEIPAYAPMPPGGTGSTVAVAGGPELTVGRFEHGDTVYFEDTRTPPSTSILGRGCVVWLADGRIFMRRIQRARKEGSFDLFSITYEPMIDQRVSFASPVTWIKLRD